MHELSYSAPTWCSENRGFDSCRGLRFRTNNNGFVSQVEVKIEISQFLYVVIRGQKLH